MCKQLVVAHLYDDVQYFAGFRSQGGNSGFGPRWRKTFMFASHPADLCYVWGNVQVMCLSDDSNLCKCVEKKEKRL